MIFDELDKLTLVYGPAASGKSTLAMQISLEFAENNRVLFFDSENSFSIERIKLMSNEYEKLLENILVIKIKDFEDQHKKLSKVEELVKKGKFKLVVIDSFGKFYRYALHSFEYKEVNKGAISMLRNLKHVVNLGILVLVTNQIYSNNEGKIEALGGKMIKNLSDNIIELTLEPRTMKFHKPSKKEVEFVINNLGCIPL